MTFEELLIENAEVDVMDMPFNSDNIKGLYSNGIIAINSNIDSSAERACILAEELGHYYTSVGNILDMSDTGNRKQEHIARAWAYQKLIGLEDIIHAFEKGCRHSYEFAEHLNVTEEFLIAAMNYFKQKYGYCKKVGNYTLIFHPHYDIIKNLSVIS